MRFTATEWSESFGRAMAQALGSDFSLVKEQVLTGVCQAWQFEINEKIVGHAVTRLEKDTLVVVAYQGSQVVAFGELITQICELKELPYARFHTQHPGLIRLLKEFDPEPLEYVIRIKCHGR